jgi:hypothetical protein
MASGLLPLPSKGKDCGHEGEAGFLAAPSVGFIQNNEDPRCIHCAWTELQGAIPPGWWLDRMSFLLIGWRIEVANPTGEVLAEQGKTPAEAMDKMKAFLVERKNNG